MTRRGSLGTVSLAAVVTAGSLLAAAPATAGHERGDGRGEDRRRPVFEHVGTFDVRANGTGAAEIVDFADGGRTVVYTDAETGQVGFVDVRDPSAPAAAGAVAVGGEPTSVAVRRALALVTVDTSESFTDPSGVLAVLDSRTRAVVRTLDLGGQPDSLALSADGRYAAVVVENERDEDVADGLLPQLPGGYLVVVDLDGRPDRWTTRRVELTGLAEVAPEDPEPEFVDIDRRNRAVVSLQENNHLAVVDLRRGRVVADFPAGEVTLAGVDATEDELGPQEAGLVEFTETITKRREPDAVQWIGRGLFATANEGDYEDAEGDEGGSRGITVFDSDGAVVVESGPEFEYALAAVGHYPEARSENKGVEPEALEYAEVRGTPLLVVGAERGNALGVYDVSDPRAPELRQVLPTGVGPEGLRIDERRGLLAVANETAVEDVVPSLVTFYRARHADRRGDGPSYPYLASDLVPGGAPVPWVAMSGLAGDLNDPDLLYGVSDAALAAGYVYPIDVSGEPARVLDRIRVTDPAGLAAGTGFDAGGGFFPDVEGIAVAPEGGFWLASEGRAGARPNALLRTDAAGAVTQVVELPADLAAGATNSGFEGIAVTGDGVSEYVHVAVQRGFADDPADTTTIGRYEVATGEWTFVRYGLEPATVSAVGLSELTLLPDGTFGVVERDASLGPDAALKAVYRVDLAGAEFRPFGGDLATVPKTLALDLLPALDAVSVWTPDKLEGLAVAADGRVYAVTDNDGLDDNLGETVFLRLGRAFGR